MRTYSLYTIKRLFQVWSYVTCWMNSSEFIQSPVIHPEETVCSHKVTNLAELDILESQTRTFLFISFSKRLPYRMIVVSFQIVKTTFGLKVSWYYGERLIQVSLTDAYANIMEGLCGNFNGNLGDDLNGPAGPVSRFSSSVYLKWMVAGVFNTFCHWYHKWRQPEVMMCLFCCPS